MSRSVRVAEAHTGAERALQHARISGPDGVPRANQRSTQPRAVRVAGARDDRRRPGDRRTWRPTRPHTDAASRRPQAGFLTGMAPSQPVQPRRPIFAVSVRGPDSRVTIRNQPGSRERDETTASTSPPPRDASEPRGFEEAPVFGYTQLAATDARRAPFGDRVGGRAAERRGRRSSAVTFAARRHTEENEVCAACVPPGSQPQPPSKVAVRGTRTMLPTGSILSDFWNDQLVAHDRQLLLLVLVSLLGAFAFIRLSARLGRSPRVPWWPGSVVSDSGVHLHHLACEAALGTPPCSVVWLHADMPRRSSAWCAERRPRSGKSWSTARSGARVRAGRTRIPPRCGRGTMSSSSASPA